LLHSISEAITNRAQTRREIVETREELAKLAAMFNEMIKTVNTQIESVQDLLTKDKERGMRVDALEKDLEKKHEELIELSKKVAYIEGRLSK